MLSDDREAESRELWSAVLSVVSFGDNHVRTLTGVDTLLVPFTTTSPLWERIRGPQCSH